MNCWTNSSTNSIWKKRGCIDALCGIWGVGKSLPCFMQRYGLMLPEELAGWVLGQTMVHGPEARQNGVGLPRNRAYGLVTLTRMNFCGAAVRG